MNIDEIYEIDSMVNADYNLIDNHDIDIATVTFSIETAREVCESYDLDELDKEAEKLFEEKNN